MGIDYTVRLAVGFRISDADLMKRFAKKEPEKSHMEKRFDPKTGKRLKDEKVIDYEGGEFLYDIDGKEETDETSLLEQICEKIGGKVTYVFDGTGYNDVTEYIIGPDLPEVGEAYEDGKVTVHAGCSLADFGVAVQDLARIRKALGRIFDLDIPPAEVVPAVWVC